MKSTSNELTIPQACHLLDVSRKELERLLAEGELESRVQVIARYKRVIIPRKSVERLMRERRDANEEERLSLCARVAELVGVIKEYEALTLSQILRRKHQELDAISATLGEAKATEEERKAAWDQYVRAARFVDSLETSTLAELLRRKQEELDSASARLRQLIGMSQEEK